MTSKKDYLRAVEIILQTKPNNLTLQNAFIEFFKNDNPLFDEARFRKACQGNK